MPWDPHGTQVSLEARKSACRALRCRTQDLMPPSGLPAGQAKACMYLTAPTPVWRNRLAVALEVWVA